MTNTEEDIALPASTPQDEASRSFMRQTSCKKANCPICSEPTPGTHHVRDLTQELETTPPPKKFSKPHAPPDHIFSTFLEELQQAIINNKLDKIQDLLLAFKLHVITNPDYFKFDCSELNKYLETARNLTKPLNQTAPAPTTQPPCLYRKPYV